MTGKRLLSAKDKAVYFKLKREVLKRDKRKCVLCHGSRSLQLHHIIRWADSPSLRFHLNNCVTLCYMCHRYKVGGKEKFYISMFNKIARENAKNNS